MLVKPEGDVEALLFERTKTRLITLGPCPTCPPAEVLGGMMMVVLDDPKPRNHKLGQRLGGSKRSIHLGYKQSRVEGPACEILPGCG